MANYRGRNLELINNDKITNKRVIKKKKVNKEKMLWFITILFILTYLLYAFIKFLTTEDLSYITAVNGVIKTTTKTQGIITRHEHIIYSDKQGYIKYLFVEGEKIPANSVIAYLSSEYENILDTKIDELNNELSSSIFSYNDDYIKTNIEIKNLLHNYVTNKSNYNFEESYTVNKLINKLLRERYENYIVENNKSLQKILMEKKNYEEQLFNTSQHIISEESGIICYSYDGYENLQYNDINESILDNYENNLNEISIEPQMISSDKPVYKLITDQKWYVTIFTDKSFSYTLDDSIEIVINNGEKVQGKVIAINPSKKGLAVTIELNQYVHKYLEERIVTVTIDNTSIEGIKLPNSCLVKEELIGIPKSYLIQSKGILGVILRTSEGDTFVQADIVHSDKDYYYIMKSEEHPFLNDTILPDKTKDANAEEYTINKTIVVEGVYIINKGYKEFKTIEKLYETKDYSIVASNTANGIRLYDRVLILNNKDNKTIRSEENGTH